MPEVKTADSAARAGRIVSVLALLACAALTGYAIACADGWKFVLFLLCYVLLPGLGFCAVAFEDDFHALPQRILLAFFIGVGYLFVQFYVLCRFDAARLIAFLSPATALVLAVFLLARQKKTSRPGLPQLWNGFCSRACGALSNWPFFLLLLGCTAASCLMYGVFFRSPLQNTVSPDMAWLMGNINTFASAEPFDNFRIAGTAIRYHYFPTLFFSVYKIVFGTSAFNCITQLPALLTPLLMSLSFYALASRAAGSHGRAAFLSACGLAGFSPLLRTDWFFVSWVRSDNGIALALPCLILTVLIITPLLSPRHGESALCGRHAIARIALCFFINVLLTGMKSPYGILTALAVFTVMAVRLFSGEGVSMRSLGCLAALTAGFLVTYLSILTGTDGMNMVSDGSLFQSVYLAPGVDKLNVAALFPNNELLRRLTLLLPAFLLTFGICAPFAVLHWREACLHLFAKRRMETEFLFDAALSLICVTAYFVIDIANGNSQVYFLFAAIPLLLPGCCRAFDTLAARIKPRVARRVLLVGVIGFCALTVCMRVYVYGKALSGHAGPEEDAVYYNQYLTEAEYEGLCYLKNETPPDCLIATNRQNLPGKLYDDPRYCMITALSERRCNIEGYGYDEYYTGRYWRIQDIYYDNCQLFSNWDDDAAYDYAMEKGIDYLAVFHEEKNNRAPSDVSRFEPVFANGAISIFRVRQPQSNA